MPQAGPVLSVSEATKIISAAPMATVGANPASDTKMKSSWVPPRKVWAGGVAAILSWLIIHALATFANIDVQGIAASLGITDPVTILSGLIGTAIAWVIPPSTSDVITHLNDVIINLAQRDPESNVSYVLPPVVPPAGASPVIQPPR